MSKTPTHFVHHCGCKKPYASNCSHFYVLTLLNTAYLPVGYENDLLLKNFQNVSRKDQAENKAKAVGINDFMRLFFLLARSFSGGLGNILDSSPAHRRVAVN